MKGRRWTRDELLAALNFYLRTPFGRLHARNPKIIEIASNLNRTANAVAMKCCNFASLDPSIRKRGLTGLQGVSALDRELYEEFAKDPEQIGFDSELAFSSLVGRSPRTSPRLDWPLPEGQDREVVRKTRVNQHLFRALILASYRNSCAVCGLGCRQLLVAAHIVSWASDPSQRMNPCNGLCLCALHDRAYDRGLLSVDVDFVVHISSDLFAREADEPLQTMLLRYHQHQIKMPDRWSLDPNLLQRHSESVKMSSES